MELWLSLFLAFIISFLLTPLIMKLAKKFSIIDLPTRQHPAVIHKKPTPRAGGIPPLIAFVSVLLIISLISPFFALNKAVIGIIMASLLVVIVGTLDDKYDLNPYFRLGTNILVALIIVGFGIGITSFTNPFGGLVRLDSVIYNFTLPSSLAFLSGTHSIILFADLVAFAWIIWIMNALNWSSGVDGQLSGIAVIALCILGFASAQLIVRDQSQLRVSIIAFSAAGAFLGFLPWSFYPQKIMPGYGGSTLAGLLISVLAILSGAKLATALLILLIPLVDSIWTVTRRVFNKRSPVWGDSFHLHHQLIKLGFSIPQICLLYYSVSLILGLIALNLDSQAKFFALATIGVLIFSLLYTFFVLLKKTALRK